MLLIDLRVLGGIYLQFIKKSLFLKDPKLHETPAKGSSGLKSMGQHGQRSGRQRDFGG